LGSRERDAAADKKAKLSRDTPTIRPERGPAGLILLSFDPERLLPL
jgi:hypothetical protein